MMRVLLVEDDRFLAKACEAALRQHSFEVVIATQGDEALRIAREPEAPHVIVLDLLLPKVSGIDVLRSLKEDPATRDIPVVVLSISAREADRRRADELGAAAFYPKTNLSLKQLAADISRLVPGRLPDDQ